MLDQWPGVSARGVLDGEAEALAGLCDRRGPSVVGYCEYVCGPERAIEAASAAFAAFRAGALRAPDPLAIDAEALLLGRTRAAAAQRAPKSAGGFVYADVPCSQIATLLAENATGSLSPADRDRLRRHLARCVSCRATQSVQAQAERAYFHPPSSTVDPISRQEIIEALRRAVPGPTVNGNRPIGNRPPIADRPVAAIPDQPAAPPLRQASVGPAPILPRTVPVAGSALTSTRVGKSPAKSPPATTATPRPAPATPPPTPQAAGPSVPAAPNLPGSTSPPPVTGSAPKTGRVGGAGGAAASGGPAGGLPRAGGVERGPAGRTPFEEQDTPPNGMPAAGWDSPTGVMSAVELDEALGDGGADDGDPASYAGWDGHDAASGEPDDRPPPGRHVVAPVVVGRAGRLTGARILGPAAVLVVGLLIALFVAGVFNGGSGHPTTDPLAGAQNDPSTTVPSTSGSSTDGGGAGTSVGGSSGASTSASAASRRAARKRADELARQLKTGSTATETKAKTKTTTGSATTPTAKKPTVTPPAAKPTTPTTNPTTPAKTTKPSSTVHELGSGGSSAPPVTDVPPAGVTGYQPS
ncbi:MAG TPA: zf-HC2 domain-containing protein [Solirubrobacteraceae bacterium]|jgi:hypothetical protein|nr:zf-HC2 domain-containing protein [Solirubrobacteraceae bacterium]